jgi:hypothetical protein
MNFKVDVRVAVRLVTRKLMTILKEKLMMKREQTELL